jgi:hypothetical protein
MIVNYVLPCLQDHLKNRTCNFDHPISYQCKNTLTLLEIPYRGNLQIIYTGVMT